MASFETAEIVLKLTGEVNPVGECHTDAKRMLNLIEFCSLVDKMIVVLMGVAREKDSRLGSCKEAGQYAQAILDNLKKSLQDEDLVSPSELLEMVRLCERALNRHCPDSYTAHLAKDMIEKAEGRA